MPRVVLDSTILVSAFLAERGLSAELLRFAREGAFILCLSPAILAETEQVLLQRKHIRTRYEYKDQAVYDYIRGLRSLARLSVDPPAIKPVTRDPEDDMVIACAVMSRAEYLVTRDKDLLSLGSHERIRIMTPEEFMPLLRKAASEDDG
jgi:putative PIN family toxin of toxin-antitoxin system